ncbi:hypothetical protein GQ600_22342 [Phytophthora cactorum]|nr:hypothetical protein GQ600_22342 [Phytophthora cactorum]
MFTEAPRTFVGTSWKLSNIEVLSDSSTATHMESNKTKQTDRPVSTMLEQYMEWNEHEREKKSTTTTKTDDKSGKRPKLNGITSLAQASTEAVKRFERPSLPANITPNVIKENGTVPTNIDGLDGTATLLDSGSDDSLAAHAVVDALKTRGVHMETCKRHEKAARRDVPESAWVSTFRSLGIEGGTSKLEVRQLEFNSLSEADIKSSDKVDVARVISC